MEKRPQTGTASEEEQDQDTVACVREIHLGIERKCSSMTVSSTSSMEAEMDFTSIKTLPSGMEDFSKCTSECGEREREPEVERDDFEEMSRSHSVHLMDKSTREKKLPEEVPSHEL